MKKFLFLVLFLIFGWFLYMPGLACAFSNETTNEILIKYKEKENIEVIKIKDKENYQDLLDYYNSKECVEYAEPNFIYRAAIIPSDSYFNNQWYLKKIKAPEAWNTVRESSGVVIAIIDTGVQIDHPDLRDNIWKNKKEIPDNGIDDDRNGFIDDVFGWDFVNNLADPRPKFKEGYTQDGIIHGTVVAGIAAASGNNASGITGVSWNTKIIPLKALNDKGEGDTKDIIKAIDYAILNGADIINFSFVGFGFSKSLETAIRRAYKAGVVMVAAAGNEENEEKQGYFLDEVPMYPVCHDGNYRENMVIGVAATDALDQKAKFSGYGFKCIDISAPGVSIFSTSVYSPNQYFKEMPFDKYHDGYWSGTSMAVPMVSATISLVEALNPSLSIKEVVDIVINNSDNINRLNPDFLGRLGKGRLNVFNSALEAEKRLKKYSVDILFAPYSKKESNIFIADKKGNIKSSFFAYDENFTGGVNMVSGDVDGDSINEIITGAGVGSVSYVKIFDVNGVFKKQFLAYRPEFRGGVKVAIGDMDGDGINEIITGPGAGGGPHIRIFNEKGELEGQFFAYNKDFEGGVNIASGDVDGDGIDEIITGPGEGGGAHVRIFRKNGHLDGEFFAYDKNFRGGVNVAVGSINGKTRNHKSEIITAPGKGGGPHVKIFDNHAKVLIQFFAFKEKFKGGVNISAVDMDYDGIDEIIAGAGPGGAPHVRVFNKNGKIISSFYAWSEDFDGGVNVSSIKY
ncbi:hypothetical protein A2331_01485 [Candidatus Falkowbacteria bacterium RIFOXYB2_FULL_34_18]|uniref:Peptidase S8/S53 domain-containing protein n=1 Tax=Candidatus Falkowbacteria bacterium RIFOXYD2_FULL_34_120 TaxID=1798007 RepID=A0A1F5TPH1_9BACT|nr:MAG: hypothetical protein A2331_01485 [Candidatus Falkowbacteria bacterium RIFOXYB2_FULL_34_18]OGF29288.1 MAG: hypothetical protein A2500_05365 [Candidatus Falkowbacteria bacterium RIFOXYC12_FULL_34_55]OGF36404.1 MAG: hypothetical protein A2466_01025 [Candidatus Falkowbacteria bacterium RIFOXYC2_FULL_34_220]OGF38883.1 MAG: hypothetical protein A2515_05785 [Candidatus Falkowbacteria bacterium RIFOXYD12_FULL_34_57]OGF40902.1 MAG: hypothetical protein A2531_04010 [Candidatus Falkowbacteria bact